MGLRQGWHNRAAVCKSAWQALTEAQSCPLSAEAGGAGVSEAQLVLGSLRGAYPFQVAGLPEFFMEK